MQLEFLRKKYPRFIYEKYSHKISGNNLEIFFDFRVKQENKVLRNKMTNGSYFRVPPDIKFRPKITIKNLPANVLISQINTLDNLVFNLGMMEIPSYWKATCSPEIIIKAGALNKEQIKWWKDLMIKGLGQFFYENKINFKSPRFLNFNVTQQGCVTLVGSDGTMKKKGVMAPLGGGKDSAVTLELLKKNTLCFSLNPTKAAKKMMKSAHCKNPVIVRRKIDKRLLELNRRGFLNGHTPFSAYLAFLSVLTAAISGKKYVALSNERSSNEGNIKYLGETINHQWSKSFEFEKKFRKYSKKYLSKDVEYFSFLRPLYEIQIAKLFSKFPKYFNVFLSCNEAYKTASGTKKPKKVWCGECSKCLFAFIILYPFISEKKLLKIFGKNLFENKNLLPIMRQLTGDRGFKPFECVGTKEESLAALYLSREKTRGELPFLLKYFEEKILSKHQSLKQRSKKMLTSWDKENNLPEFFGKLLRKNISEK